MRSFSAVQVRAAAWEEKERYLKDALHCSHQAPPPRPPAPLRPAPPRSARSSCYALLTSTSLATLPPYPPRTPQSPPWRIITSPRASRTTP